MAKPSGILIAFLGIIMLALLHPAPGWAQPRDKCPEEYESAEEAYLEGRFGEAIHFLQTCLDREDLDEGEAVRIYRLMALVFVNDGDFEQARLALVNLLGRSPNYEPDPLQDPPSYAALVRLVKEQLADQQPLSPFPERPPETEEAPPRERRSWFSGPRRWLILAGGAAVAGTVAALVFGGAQQEPGPQPLPLPPALP